MLNGQKIIRLFVFSLVIFTLLLNLFKFGYVEFREINYAGYNAQVYERYFESVKKNALTEADLRIACSSFKPDLFFPIESSLGSSSSLVIIISILALFIVKLYCKIFNKKIFLKREKYILITMVVISIVISLGVSLIESDYYYFGMGCADLL